MRWTSGFNARDIYHERTEIRQSLMITFMQLNQFLISYQVYAKDALYMPLFEDGRQHSQINIDLDL